MSLPSGPPRTNLAPAIFRARQSDLPAAAALVTKVVHECVAAWLDPLAIADYCEFATAQSLASRFEGGHEFWIAREGGEMAAVLEVKCPAHILMLFVHPRFQRQGFGRALLSSAFPGFPFAHRQTITVNSVPPSVPAYERMGFVRAGREQNIRGIRFVPMRLPVPL